MNPTPHTPGPWIADRDAVRTAYPIGALAYVSTGGGRGRTFDEAMANARLIAAAPDLLALVKRFLAMLSGPTFPAFRGSVLEAQIMAAIAKAEGVAT